ncbi:MULTISPECIES: hypothetical protein [Nitrosomonas]|uniref:Membrane protein n=1 Tax=Nitrosomonas communis TaxID=44574 RepID=A0A0F7KDP3_9PROT|nr:MULTISPECIES: hypothetical protein [Nitrosomonas]AKH36902.1 membrane protein [Nitrosomonas communis]AKH37303.1 membrane protein [Nitrosomonas communis]TYP82967.1 hypothetical protein BCL69_104329 [Nitrosomonas communis]TYP86624.1 hypothetical protein BCL69_10303 [Nitrosomonas communis]UVS62016.1 hypothetical protein NX761_02465 [Nitrosomonas sp. PLL12]
MWFQIIAFALSAVLSAVFAPKPPKPASSNLDDFNVPTVSEATPIPVVFGTRWINQANTVWYGDFKKTAIKSSSGKK